jgi:hypothetical protein
MSYIPYWGSVVADIIRWGGTVLTGRDISQDLRALTDDTITGILKTLGDIGALENLITRIGQTTDPMVAPGAVGSLSAKLRRATQGLEELKTMIVLAGANITQWGGVNLTGRDISQDLRALTDPAIAGLMRSIGDIGALENLVTRIGLTTAPIVAPGAAGSLSAKLRRATQGLEELKTMIVLAAGANIIGRVRLCTASGDEITDDVLDAVRAVLPIYTTAANGGVNVGVASTLILAANAARQYAAIVNDSDTTIYLGFGAAAVAHQGIRINAEGGSYEINHTNLYRGVINGIHADVGNKVVCILEGD